MNDRGISLLEVVVTTVLLGLLAGIATLSVGEYLNNGKKRIAESDIHTLTAATRLYLLDHAFPSGTFDAASALVPEYLPELPADPFSANAQGAYGFEITTLDGSPAIRIHSLGPSEDPVESYVK